MIERTLPDRSDVTSDPTPRHEASDLLRGSTTAEIRLEDRVYTLRLTRAGKLILTK
ncbi:Hemin uptake protein hemP [Palleronia marisminoris]|uniref:Hemin uptake protein hemP n=1 Tax=Palleronia marisminoris TaxID=315423 RepID=A0A1Y5S1L2_9RHOB|nr:hemin uptake protein HemP [Palleronia marisminoris]SFG42402.1 Hemin uptake protein hemP [Palleronia marisminoris]SLN27600.1 Hemin uptake protein hemP [Palleronia marisminoris]